MHEQQTQPDSPHVERLRTVHGAAYAEAGAGEPLVLVHGVGMRLEAWAPQIAGLSMGKRVIAVDLPGHGASDKLPPGSRLEEFVDWLGIFLDDLELDSVNIAGHSMGALIAGGAAATFGRRVSRVALLNGVYRRDPSAKAAVIARAMTIRAGSVDVEGPMQRWFGEGSQMSAVYRLTRGWLSAVDHDGYATAYHAFAHGDDTFAGHWANVNCPALFLTGSQDPNSTPEMAIAMAQATPNGCARIVDGHRHMVNLTAPDAVNAILKDWLSREDPE
ncbi:MULTISPECIES: alpha/beta fold hydrolase [unclassified Rhizobium]|uniref:alpha/beta fold hydrolase n=1 Tax=unclassified Rhizobium TaxID=2613769 RepID=UPI001ADAED63|nr:MULTISPECIES: alpha/beta hydrolase [unclassified Rhizobium]MBO9099642.1 alpha/beta hydrolase [Rhizobium sp. L58/93]QXZ86889.1 alpha/beta hydrolase [Rhizobium sp. K1/93]QXZ93078.1 alpha/beta hydrolase [Rhizobium sp. K15/93]